MKKNSLFFTTLLSIAVYIVSVLLLLYIFQIQFLDYFYEKNKIDNIVNISNNIRKLPKDELQEYLENSSYEYNVCSMYVSDNVYNYNSHLFGCVFNLGHIDLESYVSKLKNENLDYIKLIGKDGIKSIIYYIDLGNNDYVLLNTNLESLDIPTKLLKEQIVYIVLLFVSIGIIFSIILSRTITKPILTLTKSARELEKGNYDVKFDGGNVSELCELADLLTVSASEMKNTDELRKDLIANVSHDLKTPLTMIKAYAEKVRDFTYKDPKKREKDLNIIIQESERLNGLVNDLLDLSRLESNNTELEISEYNLSDQIKDVLKRYDLLQEEGKVNFEVNLPNDSVLIKADKKRMDQVFYNLINNAIEHAGDDKKVIISVKTRQHHHTISIKNNGEGINKEEMALVWNRYYTKKKNHKRNIVGTGLGLSIVKTILEKHNFEYGIDSKHNSFTTFYFRIKK
ncbi:MAG: HAMP domain-containing histidine kinase [Bacilli bacterium]|nr:HAMP domain-containing histidine kinase [Bacilli bacterium]